MIIHFFSHAIYIVALLFLMTKTGYVEGEDAQPLPELVEEGRPSINAVYNPAHLGVVNITPKGHVTCEMSTSREIRAAANPLACRDARIQLKKTSQHMRHYFQDGVHQISGPISSGAVHLHIGSERAYTWSMAAVMVPLRCGQTGAARATRQLTLDITCRDDVAVVRWVQWRSFLVQSCDKEKRNTRAIGPDLTCDPILKDDHAHVIASGWLLLDLSSGVVVEDRKNP